MSPVLTPTPRPAAARLLFIGNGAGEHLSLQRILQDWNLRRAGSCAQAMAAIDLELPNVIVCEEELPDGTWRSVVSAVQIRPAPPPVIVLSYREDERLWAEVLRRGGFDVLACPLDPSRTRLAIDYAALRSHSESSPPGVMRMAAQGY